MIEADPNYGSDTIATREPGISYVAVGIPQGVYVDPVNGESAGAVRRGGELVSLHPADYRLWALLLTPMTLTAATVTASKLNWGDVDPTIMRLRDLDLLITIDPETTMDVTLARLRPLPLGLGLGNTEGDPERFAIQNGSLSLPSPVSLDVVAIMFWWEFDGLKSLREVAAHVAARLPNVSVDRAGRVATQLAYGLMANRLLYLDSPVRQRGA